MADPAPRAVGLATALDVLTVLLIATALVSALGAELHLGLPGLPISTRQWWRLLLLAAVIVGVRWRLLRHTPRLGAFGQRPGTGTQDVSPVASAVLPARWGVIAVLLVLAALWPLRDQLLDLRRVPDLEDPLFSAWRVGWFAHQIGTDPARLFDGNIFYPAPLTLTYSDAHLLLSALAAPLIWLGTDALVAANLLLVTAFPLAALSYGFAAWRLVGDVRAAIAAGVLGAWYPFHFEHISHLELQWFCWMPLTIVALTETIAHGGWKRGAALGAAAAAQALSSMYFGVMLAMYLVPFATCLLVGWRPRRTAAISRAFLAAAPLLLLPAIVLGPPYLAGREARGDRDLRTVAEFSAEGRDYRVANVHSATWVHHLSGDRRMERALFSGVTPLALAAAALIPPLTVVRIALLVSGALAVDWSLGVNGLTFDEVRNLALPVKGLRAPARFAVLAGTSLILLAAFGVGRLFSTLKDRRARHAVFALMVVLIWLDLRPRLTLVHAWRPPPIYGSVGPQMVLAEFPMRYDWNISYMYFSTTHWARLVNGYSGYLPHTFDRLQQALAAFPAPETLLLVKQQGATHFTMNCRFYGGDAACAPILRALETEPGVRLVTRARWEDSEVRLYELRTQN